MTLRLASYGMRGYVGKSLTPRVAMDFAAAFGTFVDGGRVLLGRDTRYSSPMFHSAVAASLMSCGCEVLDFGICPTPILQFSVGRYGAAGAISISGGHNQMGWNALTLIGSDGAFLEPSVGEAVLDAYHATDFLRCDATHLGTMIPKADFFEPYLQALTAMVDCESIRRAGYTVLIDPVGGAGCPYLDDFAREFGLRLVAINGEPSGYLAREPEPRPRSALQIASFIRHVKGHAGFVLSSDMGRLSLVSETGEPLSEEYTFPLVARHVLSRRVGPIVTNICTSRMVDDVAASAGAPLVKTSVGQAFVVAKMIDESAPVGGEGSGGVAIAGFSRAFDGFLVISLILELMATTGEPLSALVRSLPRYHQVKRSTPCRSLVGYQLIENVAAAADRFAPKSIDVIDGVRFDWDDGWLHVRVSRTEQLIRVISEARTRHAAEARAEEALRLIGQGTP
jgi:phosphomannomutase